jgi:lipid-binding SYLF domain-containing protein
MTRSRAFFGVTMAALAAAVIPVVGCSSQYKESGGQSLDEQRVGLIGEARETAEEFRRRDSSLGRFFDTSVGYVVFPKVSKGAVGVGAARGEGVLFEGDSIPGYVDLTQGSVGLQLGGQTYSEIIFFENERVLRDLKRSNFEFQAQASAVAADEGVGATRDYDRGVAVFTMVRGGLMFEAAIGGQQFDYYPR